jgi:parallel beta-helix repeat protein
MRKRYVTGLVILFVSVWLPFNSMAQKFSHPGINQTSADLKHMKQLINNGEQPYKDAFERLQKATDLNFIVRPYTHVVRGGYGNPNIGGDDLSKSAGMAYNCALMWYITDNKAYAGKAIEILNAWAPVLWDFDDNDAKLLAAWTGHQLCNAAEILRYTKSGWVDRDIDSFTNMLMTVYYPLIRYYFPQANGNWDGAIIHTILAIAIFTDNHEMFDNAIDHFLHGPVNGSIFKYIYPSGQCQESTRDQGHVQLGLGEFAGAAQVAYTQGVDLFSIADNRIALGFEYTARFILGEKTHCYGVISPRAKNLRDDYEYVYRHYSSKGIDLPWTKMAADSTRSHASRSILTSVRKPSADPAVTKVTPKPNTIGYPAGAKEKSVITPPAGSLFVIPGESLQEALNSKAGTGRWVVAKAGIHKLSTTLKIPSGVNLTGEGKGTVLFLDPESKVRNAIVNATADLHDVTIRDLVVEGALSTETPSDPNSRRSYRSTASRGGIIFLAQGEDQIKNINLINITVQNCTYNGVFISGATGVNVIGCDFNENGSNVIPGPKLQHNLLLTHCKTIVIKDSRLDTSPFGSGISVGNCSDAAITGCEIARNAYYGLLISECKNISVNGNLIEGNDRSGVMVEFLQHGSESVKLTGNLIQYNNGFGVESYGARGINSQTNVCEGNGNSGSQEKISNDKNIIMQ